MSEDIGLVANRFGIPSPYTIISGSKFISKKIRGYISEGPEENLSGRKEYRRHDKEFRRISDHEQFKVS